MIITDETPPSPLKSSSALSNPQSPGSEPLPPPAYGVVQGRTVSEQFLQPYDAAGASSSSYSNGPSSPLLPQNRAADLERSAPRRGESVGKRFCKALAVALLIYGLAGILLGTLSMNIRGFRTRKGWHKDFPIPNNVGVIACTKGSEMKNTTWGFPFESTEPTGSTFGLSSLSMNSSQTLGLGSVQTSFSLPLSYENFFLLSRGVFSSGNLRIMSSPNLEETETAVVDIKITYNDFDQQNPSVLHETSVCLVQKREGRMKKFGVGLFSPREWPSSDPMPPPYFSYDVTLILPEPRGPSAHRLNSLETDLPNFGHIFSYPLDEFVTFGSITLRGGNVIYVESITADTAEIHTSNGEINIKSLTSRIASVYSRKADIKGHFTVAHSLEIKAASAKVKADIDLIVPSSSESGNIIVETTNKAIEANVNIHNPSSIFSQSSPGYSITMSTDGPIDLLVPSLPLDSALRLAASSTDGRVTARLPATYEGAYTLSTSKFPGQVYIGHHEDPAGLGRQRMLGSDTKLGNGNSYSISDTIYWDQGNKEKGLVNLKSKNGGVKLYL
ncbi:hypothetical protein GYMLUDRAFT_243849 [Collybiopsis luxurians FD-317 M1]|uniref:DUF7330 domain-containing protein n=1 Tax=Collybiopsis luxurians FD-317 M1 TaxID=944289 RepID=A0A0D0CQA3_9AGAR|nr:hypothetical protein GYMLUDRAFT_243849 [Collybiopsis luxurians FD-317 M1]